MKKENLNNKNPGKKGICIVGIGNTLRSDDGVGAYVCELIEEKKIEGVTVITVLQPDAGLIEDLIKFDTVLFVDASITDETFSFQPLSLENNQPQSFSHHVNAAMLVSVARTLFATDTQFYICAIGAVNFEMGNILSEKARSNALECASFLFEWIQSNS